VAFPQGDIPRFTQTIRFRQTAGPNGLKLLAVCAILCAQILWSGHADARGPGRGLFGSSSWGNPPESNTFGDGQPPQFPSESGPGIVSGAAVFAYVPPAPASVRWVEGRLTQAPSLQSDSGELSTWGYSIGPRYFGVVTPVWYGGFPFAYAVLDYGTYWNPYYGLSERDFAPFDAGLFTGPS
jgi:hypothetical protein